MKKKLSLPFVLTVLLVGTLIPASLTPSLFVLKPFGWEDVGQLLTFLILVALFLERALEVFITTWRRPGEEIFDNRIQACERKIAELKNQIDAKVAHSKTVAVSENFPSNDPMMPEQRVEVTQTPGDVSELQNWLGKKLIDLEGINANRREYKSQTRKVALWTALFVGVLLSGVGIRALETLVVLKDFPNGDQPIFYNQQMGIFRVLDTILTGGLIAGGSEGIHKITQVFTTFLEQTRNQMQDRPKLNY
ncbi:MAG: hypothetical protein HC825_05750 [Oscillatoriales cyanobacterium RM1_1_9]|nr:hypothetical protein [Oscillatoriales cyanobacterium SM2_3_0]NJO44389.1 hypothetical protein [Oscillatoriales cyanobacterium RM2_1_1]NJO71323.1 hypothetical protein [Oscillatoriales cyanobacterium RM1_1_9]